MKKFCPKCGKTISKGTFCKDCVETRIDYKPIKVKLCPSQKYHYKGSWKEFKNMEDLTNKLVNLSLKNAIPMEIIDEEILQKTGFKGEINVLIEYQGEEYYIPFNVEVTYSPEAAKLNTEYFEGILQVRNLNSHKKEIEKIIDKNNYFVTKTVKVGNGMDYYMISKKDIDKAVNKIIKTIGGYPDKNAQLFSRDRQTSKDIYRINYLITLPNFQKKDVIKYEDSIIYITGLDKKITGLDLEKNKRVVIPSKKEVIEKKPLKKYWVVTSQTQPELKIIDPTNYQDVKANNPLNINLVPGKKIQVVKHKEFYVLK